MNKERKIESLKDLYNRYSQCTACPALCENRTQIVFGAGNVCSDLMIVGSSPSQKDDSTGLPFSGQEGQCIQQAMNEAGFSGNMLDEAYISMAVMCWPYNEEEKFGKIKKVNREPSTAEWKACRERLLQEIYIVDPKVIIILGNSALNSLVGGNRSITSAIRDQPFHVMVPGRNEVVALELPYLALVSWDPGYLLRGAGERRPGSPADAFYGTFKTAYKIIESLKRLEKIKERQYG